MTELEIGDHINNLVESFQQDKWIMKQGEMCKFTDSLESDDIATFFEFMVMRISFLMKANDANEVENNNLRKRIKILESNSIASENAYLESIKIISEVLGER